MAPRAGARPASRRGRSALWAGLAMLAVPVLAGCLGSDTATFEPWSPRFSDGTQAPLTLLMERCTEVLGVFPSPAVQWVDHVPSNFTIVATDPAGVLTELVVIGLDCVGPDGSAQGALLALLPVEAPAVYANPEGGLHFVAVQLVTSDPQTALVLRAWGLADVVETASVHLEITDVGGMARVGTLEAAGSRLDTTVAGEVGRQDPGVLRVFATVETGLMGGDPAVVGGVELNWTASNRIGDGQALLDNTVPGRAVHNWGDGYAVTWAFVRVPVAETGLLAR